MTIKGYEFIDTLKSPESDLIAEIHKSIFCNLYWIRFLKKMNNEWNLIKVKVRIGTQEGINAIKDLIKKKLFSEVYSESLENSDLAKKLLEYL